MFKMNNARSLLCMGAVALTVATAGPAAAETVPAVDFTFTPFLSPFFPNPFFTVGYEFTANAGAAVVGLAVWDWTVAPVPVPPGSADVGLWDAAGNLLASATVTTSSPTIGAAPWLYASIAPIALTPGATYTVGSFSNSALVTFFNPDITVDQRITYDQDAFILSSSLQFPSNSVGNPIADADFGANVILGAIPEPSTWAMLLAGFAGLALAGYRTSRKAAAPS